MANIAFKIYLCNDLNIERRLNFDFNKNKYLDYHFNMSKLNY